MRTSHLLPLAALVAQRVLSQSYPHDPRAASDCIMWEDIDDASIQTCEETLRKWMMDPTRMRAWNPTVGLDCKPWYNETSYCVVTNSTVYDSLNSTTLYGSDYPTAGLPLPARTTDSAGWTIPVTRTDASLYGLPTRAPVPLPSTWTDRGCFSDGAHDRGEKVWVQILDFRSPDALDAETPDTCRQLCWSMQFPIAGILGGDACFCGERNNGTLVEDQKKCDAPCVGDKNAVCGGANLTSVWEAVDYVASGAPATIGTTAGSGSGSGSGSAAATEVTATASSGARRNAAMFWRMW
ncbi:hypothetical protein OPT61_g7851 [Boeremia exigua]|uniref:Uncharacterized protein n=1 Tax=Boeremia exigua TaxID=749465 RepID=A0ACC2I110_9PLEO|nr:hypothetical protein OPT61_g7851 [Boeremia exigua]